MFLGWDGSDIEVRGTCSTDSIIYWLYNRGAGNMNTSRTYLVTEDHIMLRTGTYQLGIGDSVRVAISIRTNSVYYIQAEQDPMHPYSSYASGGITDCSDITTGTVNGISVSPYPEDDAAPTRSIDCQLGWNNDNGNYKRAAPVGFGSLHWIEQGVDLEYNLRFQNTTGSLLQQAIFVDTLDANLDPTTLVMGASSHPYTWSLTAAGILTVAMSNLWLDTMEWGFVKFRLAQQPNLSLGTVINNSASISLGGYELTNTNTTFHTIADDFIPNSIIKRPNTAPQWLVYPNPFTREVTFSLYQGSVSAFEVRIYDALGRTVGQVQSTTGEAIQWQPHHLAAGIYVYEILIENSRVGTGKLITIP
ncbi:MAG: T9SS type A sorting domain-containing protein [Aureispira sp.]